MDKGGKRSSKLDNVHGRHICVIPFTQCNNEVNGQ